MATFKSKLNVNKDAVVSNCLNAPLKNIGGFFSLMNIVILKELFKNIIIFYYYFKITVAKYFFIFYKNTKYYYCSIPM